MRLLMGIIKDKKTGIYHARKKVPRQLEAAAAQVLGPQPPEALLAKKSLLALRIPGELISWPSQCSRSSTAYWPERKHS